MRLHAIVFAAVVVACHLPLVFLHFRNLWMMRPHYHFFPLLLIGVGWLMWQRWPQWSLNTRAPRWSTALLGFGGVLLAVGTLLWSPMLAVVALVLSLGGLLARYAAPGQWRDWLPVWMLLWLVVPPPLGLDFRLITWLQSSTSQMASRVMDLLGILHLMEGNILVLPGNRMLVDEACSGVNSVLVLFTLTALYIVAQRRPLIWAAILLVSSVAWAWAGNTVRVTSIAVAHAWYGMDLSTGWQHDVLGYVTISLALAWLISTDYCLGFLLGPIRLRGRDLSEFAASDTPVTKAWNWLVGGPVKFQSTLILATDAGALTEHSSADVIVSKTSKAAQSGSLPKMSAKNGVTLPWFAVFGLVGMLQLAAFVLPSIFPSDGPVVDKQDQLTLFEATDLPETLAGWTVVGYDFVEREHGATFGNFSSRWFLEQGNLRCVASVSRPFWEWHDLTVCYRGTGWLLLQREDFRRQDIRGTSGGYIKAAFNRAANERSWLVYGYFDSSGNRLEPPETGVGQTFRDRLRHSPFIKRLAGGQGADDLAPVYQVQVFAATDTDLTVDEQESLRVLFSAVQELLAGKLGNP